MPPVSNSEVQPHRPRGFRAFVWRAFDSLVARVGRLRGLHFIWLHYAPNAENVPRWGHGKPSHPQLLKIVENSSQSIEQAMAAIVARTDELARIAYTSDDEAEAIWDNPFFTGIDAAAIYAFLRELQPKRYIEVGSGYSTRFAARAKRDGNLDVAITSIDPSPRAAVSALTDRTIKLPLELADLTVFDEVEPGDIVFLDGSHSVYMNNDVSVFFLEVLPKLPAGVLVGVHDIYLPDDYPQSQAGGNWNEQYMLAAWLLGRGDVEVVLPADYAGRTEPYASAFGSAWSRPELSEVLRSGAAFWFRV